MNILCKRATQKPIFCINKNQPFIYDILGPFPDETFLSIIDRILYYLGVPPLQRTTKTCTISLAPCFAEISNQSNSSSDTTYRTCCSSVSIACSPNCKLKCSKEKGEVPNRSKTDFPRIRIRTPPTCLCTSACRKIKSMFKQLCSDKSCKSHWTRISPGDNGAFIHEVFKRYNIGNITDTNKDDKIPKLIFYVFQNGDIIPFETVSC